MNDVIQVIAIIVQIKLARQAQIEREMRQIQLREREAEIKVKQAQDINAQYELQRQQREADKAAQAFKRSWAGQKGELLESMKATSESIGLPEDMVNALDEHKGDIEKLAGSPSLRDSAEVHLKTPRKELDKKMRRLQVALGHLVCEHEGLMSPDDPDVVAAKEVFAELTVKEPEPEQQQESAPEQQPEQESAPAPAPDPVPNDSSHDSQEKWYTEEVLPDGTVMKVQKTNMIMEAKPDTMSGVYARDAQRAAQKAAREQANQRQGGV